ncbi:nuclear transport factor 2 family protein [Deinococcus pimensis]|uniref:nuclear transport factor 2 family protein n=1 Tax=Deinococcus pimensis TaxID=309888 RepID=UPI00047F83A8|nr:nuclear transport factor 2 family protein [Deinococcus pimensis]
MDELKAVEDVNARWNRAYRERDAGALEDVFAPDWVGVLPDMTVVPRAEMLERAVTNPPATLTFTDEVTRVFGDTATVHGLLTISGDEGERRQRYLRVFTRRGGRWWAVLAQVMVLP